MNKFTHKVPVGEEMARTSIRVEGDDCPPDSPEATYHRDLLLRSIADDPHLLDCGPVSFQKFRMYHSGQHWVIEAEAIHKN